MGDGVINFNISGYLNTLDLKRLSGGTKLTTIFSQCATSASRHQVGTWGGSHVPDNAWLPGSRSWVEHANTIFREEGLKWLSGFLVVLHLLLILPELEPYIDVAICR